MKVLILAAMEKELSLLLNLLKEIKENNNDGTHTYQGKVGIHEVIIGKCGIGKVNAALNAHKMIKTFQPDLLINSGVAGGAGIKIGSVLIADRVAYHDVWCGPGTKYGQADGLPLFMKPSEKILGIASKLENSGKIEKGLICSGDKFISTADEISFIRSNFPDVKAVDMESAAIAQTSLLSGIPFSIIRVVSDTPGEGENIEQYQDFWNKAPEKTFDIVNRILKELK